MSEATTITFDCPQCSQRLETDADSAGQEIVCPECKNIFQVPDPTSTPPTPDQTISQPPPLQPSPMLRAIDSVPLSERKYFIITTTGNEVSGQTIAQYLGIAKGIVVRSPTTGQSILGGLNQFVGGNIEAYAKLCEQARQEAFNRMIDNADKMKADAVIAFRYDATEFQPGVTEVLAYGTAVKLTP